MSFLLTLDLDRQQEILDLIPRYEQKVKEAEPIFKLEGRRIEEIMRSLPHYQTSYDQAYQDMKALEDWLNTAKEKIVARYWKKYLEGYPKQLATRDIQAYIGGEKDIVEMNQLIVEVTLIKNNLLSIVEALKQLGWMMGHITKLRISEMEDAIL